MVLGLFKRNRETPEEKQSRLEHEKRVHEEYLKARREEELLAAKRRGKEDGAKGKRTFMDKLQDMSIAASRGMEVMEKSIGEMPNVGGGIHEEYNPPAFNNQTKKSNNTQPIIIYVDDNKKKQTLTRKKTLQEQMCDI